MNYIRALVSPFRAQPHSPEAPVTAGDAVHEAVDQMVRQFADVMAFLRELVQNSLDAGATAIDAVIDWEPSTSSAREGVLHVTVTDDGVGMSLDVIERSLLVLFRSTKDGDASKIGKFGVGFFSVFAPKPSEVRVDTGTDASAEGLRVRLRPDFTYEIETSAPRRGTSVTLDLPRSLDEARSFTAGCFEALARWCPHVEVPLHAEARGFGATDRRARIDRPFDIDGDARVVHRIGRHTYAVAVSSSPRAAFYNRGILLHETDEPFVPNVSIKVNAPDLHHTLSRDNVRRDQPFEQAVGRAHTIASETLPEELLRTLNTLAVESAEARHADAIHPRADAFVTLLAFATKPPFALALESIRWPLVAPTVVDGETRVATTFASDGWFRSTRVRYVTRSGVTARVLARKGVPVIDLEVAGKGMREAMSRIVNGAYTTRALDVDDHHGLPRVAHPSALSALENALLTRINAILLAVDLGPAALGTLAGVGVDRPWITLRFREPAQLFDLELVFEVSEEAPYTVGRERVVVFNRGDARVKLAIEVAATDPRLAALVLARMVLLSSGKLDDDRDQAVFLNAILGAEA